VFYLCSFRTKLFLQVFSEIACVCASATPSQRAGLKCIWKAIITRFCCAGVIYKMNKDVLRLALAAMCFTSVASAQSYSCKYLAKIRLADNASRDKRGENRGSPSTQLAQFTRVSSSALIFAKYLQLT
jgi:hypothetical protein